MRILIDLLGLTSQQRESMGCQSRYYETYINEYGRVMDAKGQILFDMVEPKYVSEVK